MAKAVWLKQGSEKYYPAPYWPIGSIYISVVNTNPSQWFGGVWESFGTGRVLVGVDTTQTEFNEVMKTGGSKSVTLNINQIPSHYHNMYHTGRLLYWDSGLTGMGYPNYNGATPIQTTWDARTANSGGGQAHNNLQPYITVYMWRRVS